MRYLLGYWTHVSLNEIDNYFLQDMIKQLDFTYETRMQESGKSFVRKPKKDELEIAEKLKKDFEKKKKG
jgi:hypothetical protein